ncbi:MAG TPA: tRNA (adenosine(37)-N6)-threonylcarbamoyltransferase complex dimerization subunit type 1 TsaB [Spirochaetales bacterium]|nr:tRNA (adenosine(37)-N6)-threonylcarbamoyltransferase complex dimerization subunit type 1 TsaB [Spirochaetales bacterium]
MNILMFDTSMDLLSVGVARSFEGSVEGPNQQPELGSRNDYPCPSQIFCAESREAVKHSEILLPLIEACLAKAELEIEDIDLVACTSGPGSFMGLRIGMATAKGLALARSTPWVCLPTLDTLAAEFVNSESLVVPVIDARKKRVYAALYWKGARESEFLDIEPEKLVALILGKNQLCKRVLFTGQATAIVEALRAQGCNAELRVSNPEVRYSCFATLALQQFRRFGSAPEDAIPLYIREPEIGPQP